jgi:D-alanyl-lipoteichoic acid acyltransferase DltB (MBOAT superfamily)
MTPLFARSPREFWQRWHITLSTWIRDYLYIPLGGNRGTAARQAAVMLLTMGLAGLWHGAGLMFVAWGLYHGALILVYRLPAARSFTRWSEGGGWRAFVAWALFFGLTVFGWMMFRAGSGAPGEFERMAGNFINLPAIVENPQHLLALRQLGLLVVPLLAAEYTAYRHGCEFPDVLNRMRTVPLAAALTAMWFVGMTFAKRASYDFIYFAF